MAHHAASVLPAWGGPVPLPVFACVLCCVCCQVQFSGSAVQRSSGSAVQRLPMFFFFFSSLHIRAARVPGLYVRSGTKVEQGSFRLRCCNISPSLLQPFSMINKSGLNSENPTSTYVFAHSKQTVPIAPDGIQVLS